MAAKLPLFLLKPYNCSKSYDLLNWMAGEWLKQYRVIYMAFRWRADDGPTLNTGLVAYWLSRGSGPVLLRRPIYLCFFKGGPDPLSPPSGSTHAIKFQSFSLGLVVLFAEQFKFATNDLLLGHCFSYIIWYDKSYLNLFHACNWAINFQKICCLKDTRFNSDVLNH